MTPAQGAMDHPYNSGSALALDRPIGPDRTAGLPRALGQVETGRVWRAYVSGPNCGPVRLRDRGRQVIVPGTCQMQLLDALAPLAHEVRIDIAVLVTPEPVKGFETTSSSAVLYEGFA